MVFWQIWSVKSIASAFSSLLPEFKVSPLRMASFTEVGQLAFLAVLLRVLKLEKV